MTTTLKDRLSPFLCLRRGVSQLSIGKTGSLSFSLPTQRCFRLKSHPKLYDLLFSAYAEVFLGSKLWLLSREAFLCLRRGVSACVKDHKVPVFFSLPTQRCFQYETTSNEKSGLFSAYAEVFLTVSSAATEAQTFLCLRRGVSLCARVCFRG